MKRIGMLISALLAINLMPDATDGGTAVANPTVPNGNGVKPATDEKKPDPIKFTATLGDAKVNVFERTQERGRGVGKKTFSPDLDAINQDNYSKIFPVVEFWDNLVRPALKRTASLVTEESVKRDDKTNDILSFDQEKWINMFFGKVSAVSETLRALKQQKEDLFSQLQALIPPTPEQMLQFLAIAQKLKDVAIEIEEKSA